MEIMLTLLELLAVLVVIAVSLAGFAAAVAWTLAIWFDRSS
jgi:type II secretory pathway pseudopilin PulG